MACSRVGSAVKLKSVKLQNEVNDILEATKLNKEYDKSISILAENLAIAMAESKRWFGIEQVSSEALIEAMEILEISELRSSFCTFKLSKGSLEVEYNGGHLH